MEWSIAQGEDRMIGPAQKAHICSATQNFESEVSIQCDRAVWQPQHEKSREAWAGGFHPLRISNDQTRTPFYPSSDWEWGTKLAKDWAVSHVTCQRREAEWFCNHKSNFHRVSRRLYIVHRCGSIYSLLPLFLLSCVECLALELRGWFFSSRGN